MITPALRRAFRFFLDNAGYCSPPGRAACALSLARAEMAAGVEGLAFRWEYDDVPWDGEGEAPSEVLGCIAEDGEGNHLASLWGIGDPDDGYRRLIEAQLAAESLDVIADREASAVRPL